MTQRLTPVEIEALAQDRADKLFPLPKVDAAVIGLLGMVIAAVSAVVFAALANVDVSNKTIPLLIVAGLGFFVPFGYFKYQERGHYRFLADERRALQGQKNA